MIVDTAIEKKISSLIESQFPSFYASDGPTFIQFVKAYYEWLEQPDNSNYHSRRMLEYFDIDDTIDQFLVHFQQKYLYGIPFDVIINKRFLLKHVLDVYRSKGTVQCFKLLFRLIYNQDVDVYLPGRDLLRASDGRWKQVRYVEVTNCPHPSSFVGKTLIGISSGVQAIVESSSKQAINERIITTLYISNITPKGGQFLIGEPLIDLQLYQAGQTSTAVANSPIVIGSLNEIEIINGGRQFREGDLLKIVSHDLTTNQPVSSGIDGQVRVAALRGGRGSLQFSISEPGSGLLISNTIVKVYNSEDDESGRGASFTARTFLNTVDVDYCTDLWADYANLTWDALAYGFPADPTGNAASTWSDLLTFTSGTFGGLASLGNITTGTNYVEPTINDVRSVLSSHNLPGTLSYSSSGANVVGTSTAFTTYLAADDWIILQANTSLSSTIEYQRVKSIANNTHLTLYGNCAFTSTTSAKWRIAPRIFEANFEPNDPIIGPHPDIVGIPSFGNNVVAATTIIDSGKGYTEGEFVTLYLFGSITTPTIRNGGTGYANGESIVFNGPAFRPAQATVVTDDDGAITGFVVTRFGGGYNSAPTLTVRSIAGSGAILETTIDKFNTVYQLTGLVRKKGIGTAPGRFLTTDGFLNSNKRLQDSHFWQDFSYQFKAETMLSTYRDIFYQTFHIAGTEMFGAISAADTVTTSPNVLYDSKQPIIN